MTKMSSSVVIIAFSTIIVSANIGYVDARIHKMKFATTCHCAKTVSRERDDAYRKFNDAVSVSENIITMNNCLPGSEFKYDNYDNEINNYKIDCINFL